MRGSCRISIHAPRAGSDKARRGQRATREHFNPRPPCGERPVEGWEARETTLFQSTPPVRGATIIGLIYLIDINISIHAPRAGSDWVFAVHIYLLYRFQSTPPVRGATVKTRILSGFSNNSCMVIRFRPHLAPYSKHITIDMNLKADFFGANLSAKACVLPLRIRGLYYPRVNMLFCSRSAQFCFDICCQGNKSAGCPYPCPLYHTSALAGCGTARHLTSIQIPSIALSVRS